MISGLCTSTVECPVQAWAERRALGLSQDPVTEAFGSGIWYCMGWGLAQAAAALTKGALGPEAESHHLDGLEWSTAQVSQAPGSVGASAGEMLSALGAEGDLKVLGAAGSALT